MLKAQRRHRPPCKKSQWHQGYTKCGCPIVIRGTLAGKPISLSTARYLPPQESRNLETARNLAILWEQAGVPVRPELYASVSAPAAEPEVPRPTVTMAVAAFMADARDRGNSEATVYKKHVVFESALLRFCVGKGIRFLSELNLSTLREWRAGWNLESLSRAKRQGQVLGFLWFCERAGWLPRNYASDITRGLGKIQVKTTQTGYFQPEEYKAVIDATYVYSDRPSWIATTPSPSAESASGPSLS